MFNLLVQGLVSSGGKILFLEGEGKKKNPKKKTMTMVIALTLSEIVITFSFILEQLELGTSVKTCFRNIFGELFGSEGCH